MLKRQKIVSRKIAEDCSKYEVSATRQVQQNGGTGKIVLWHHSDCMTNRSLLNLFAESHYDLPGEKSATRHFMKLFREEKIKNTGC